MRQIENPLEASNNAEIFPSKLATEIACLSERGVEDGNIGNQRADDLLDPLLLP
jgi:hypothetical protein